MNLWEAYKLYQQLMEVSMIKWIMEHSVELLAIWGALSIVIDGIIGLTSSKKDDEVWQKIKNVLSNIISLKIKK